MRVTDMVLLSVILEKKICKKPQQLKKIVVTSLGLDKIALIEKINRRESK